MTAIAIMWLGGCAAVYDRPTQRVPIAVSESEETELLATSGRRRGLALSGGGIRAAYYSLGTMKALYDEGWLQEVDILSSVSGGGYAAYWLISAEAAEGDPATPFGSTLFSDDNFPVTLCNAASTANFVKSWQAPLSVITGRSVGLYDDALGRSFGFADNDRSLRMADLLEPVRTGAITYWIINSSHYEGPENADNIFEITPLYAGTRINGGRWSDWSIGVRQATSISGAAVKYIRQNIVDPAGDGERLVTLWDGGRTENLGFYSLALRNPEEMIVVDAEHDPARNIRALTTVTGYLEAAGYTVNLAEPMRRAEGRAYFETSFSAGEIARNNANPPARTDVQYLKMSVPASLLPILAHTATLDRGEAIDAEVQDRLDASLFRGEWDCGTLAGIDVDMDAWLIWTVSGYADFMRNDSYTRHFQRLLPTELKGDFPQYTTVDTSYYNDQARAFVGLGYLNAIEMRGRMMTIE